MATEQNSLPCPYGFGRLVRRPWELHLPELGYCEVGCMCEALLAARNETGLLLWGRLGGIRNPMQWGRLAWLTRRTG